MSTESNPEKRIALFQRKEVRRTIHNNEWWFVIIDVVAALSDSANPKGYFTDMRRRDPQLAATATRRASRKTSGPRTTAAAWPATPGANWKRKAAAKSSRAGTIWR
jgi:prophage antirepressor-like protein